MSFKRVFIGTVLLIMIIGSSMSVAFAEQDIEALLTNWFVKNQEEAIEGLEKSVQDEQEEQTKRLKEALQIEVKEAEEELEQFTEQQKEQISEELKEYVDTIIGSMNVNHDDEKQRIETELNTILEEAKKEIEAIHVGDSQEKDSTHTHHTHSKEEPKKDETAPDENNEVK